MSISEVAIAHQGLLTLQNDPKQWVVPNGNYSGWNYSALDQINLTNVQKAVPSTIVLMSPTFN